LGPQLVEDVVDVEAAATTSEQQCGQQSQNPETSYGSSTGSNSPSAPAVLYMGRPLNFAPTQFNTS
jgi:hypothetical protein